jgi:hypothetical protein
MVKAGLSISTYSAGEEIEFLLAAQPAKIKSTKITKEARIPTVVSSLSLATLLKHPITTGMTRSQSVHELWYVIGTCRQQAPSRYIFPYRSQPYR